MKRWGKNHRPRIKEGRRRTTPPLCLPRTLLKEQSRHPNPPVVMATAPEQSGGVPGVGRLRRPPLIHSSVSLALTSMTLLSVSMLPIYLSEIPAVVRGGEERDFYFETASLGARGGRWRRKEERKMVWNHVTAPRKIVINGVRFSSSLMAT